MKAFLVFACLIAATFAALPASEVRFLKQVHDSCQSNPATYCDENKLRNLLSNLDDSQVGIHMSCMAIKAGLQLPNGDLNPPTMRIKIGLAVQPSLVEGVMEKCSKRAENAGKTANQMWACFIQNGADYYHKL